MNFVTLIVTSKVISFPIWGSKMRDSCTSSTMRPCSVTYQFLVAVRHLFNRCFLTKIYEKQDDFNFLVYYCHNMSHSISHARHLIEWIQNMLYDWTFACHMLNFIGVQTFLGSSFLQKKLQKGAISGSSKIFVPFKYLISSSVSWNYSTLKKPLQKHLSCSDL